MKIASFEEFKKFILPALNEISDFSIKYWYILLAALIMIIIIIVLIANRKPKDIPLSALLPLLDSKKYKVINDLLFSTGERTANIDHLIISDYGIFVIQKREGKGKIFGNENDSYWTLISVNGKEKIFNPIKQNEVNINALKKVFYDYFHFNYISIIVLSNSLKNNVKSKTDVIYPEKLIREIKKYNIINISDEEKDVIFEKLLSLKI